MEPRPHPPAAPGPVYEAFLSYRHVDPDRGEAAWLHRALEAWRTPPALVAAGRPERLRPVFRDEEELHASPHLAPQLEAALASSRWLIVVCSPRTPQSPWVGREIERFRELGGGDRILAVLLEGSPETSFPAALLGAAQELGREPLAADLRPSVVVSQAAQRRTALLRLVAPMLDVRFDDLRQREAERQARRRRRLWLAGTAAVVLAGALVFSALSSEQRASRSDVAHAQARQQKDELVRVLVEDVTPAMASGVRVDALRGLLDRIGKELGDRPAETLAPEDLLHRAANLLATALVRGATSDPTGALETLREAQGALAAIAPEGAIGDRARLLQVEVLRETAETLQTLGRLAPALDAAREAVVVARVALALRATDAAAKRLLALSLTTLGLLAPAAHDLAGARAALEEAAALLQDLRVAQPDALKPRADLGAARRNLSRALAAQGEVEPALAQARAAAALLGPADDEDEQAAAQRAESLENLAEQLLGAANVRDAAEAQRASLALREAAVARDPHHDASRAAVAVSRRILAPMLKRLGQTTEAEAQLDQALAELETLRARAPDDVPRLGEWAVTLVLHAEGLARRGRYDEALRETSRALETLGTLRASGKSDRSRRTHEVQFLIAEANVHEKVPDIPAQRRDLERALELGGVLAREDPSDTSLAAILVSARMELSTALLKGGSKDEALSVAEQAVGAAEALRAARPTSAQAQELAAFTHDRLGRVLARLERPELALEAFREACTLFTRRFELAGKPPLAARDLAVAHMMVGDALSELERHAEALKALEAALAILPAPGTDAGDPTLSRTASNLSDRVGRCLGMLNQFAAASIAFEQAAKHQEVALRGGAGDARRVQEMRENAARMLRLGRAHVRIEAREEPADSSEAFEMAGMLGMRGRLEESLALFEKTLSSPTTEDERRFWTVHAADAAALLARKKPEEATALRRRSLAWLREHVVLTWARIRRFEAESLASPAEPAGAVGGTAEGLRRSLTRLEHEDPTYREMRDTPEFKAALVPPPPGELPK